MFYFSYSTILIFYFNLMVPYVLYSYVECTSAAIQALASFRKLYPGHRREEIQCCIEKAAAFIEKIQASDGSWYALPIWEFSTDIVYNGKVCFLGYSHISYLVYTLFSSFLLLFLHGFELSFLSRS